MKTARFSQVVEHCGHPESYLVLVNPAKDKTLQAAVNAHRVLTVTQATVGAKADYGQVGFQEGGTRQYLIFPKSLRRFDGLKIVGIDYDLLSLKELPASKRAQPPKPKPSPKKPKRTERMPASKVIPFQAAQEAKEKEEEEKDGSQEDEASLKELKRLAKQAMRALKAGKQVVAFELLKKMTQE